MIRDGLSKEDAQAFLRYNLTDANKTERKHVAILGALQSCSHIHMIPVTNHLGVRTKKQPAIIFIAEVPSVRLSIVTSRMPSSCPPGTLCLDTTTAVALVVILALVAYIGYLRLGGSPHPPVAEEDVGDDSGADRAPFPARAPRRRRRSTNATKVPPPTTTDDDDDPNDARIVAAATPNVTTNIFQSTTYDDPMLRPPLRRCVDVQRAVAAVPINIQTRGPARSTRWAC